MDAVIKKKKTMLAVAIILTVGFPVGIVMTVLCAINKIWILMALGIVLIVAGFYGAPICWARMADYNKNIALLRAIEEQNLYTVADLSTYLSLNEKTVVALIQSCIRNGYLSKYLFVDNARLELINSRKQELHKFSFKCVNCGAQVYAEAQASTAQCEYCGKIYSESDKVFRDAINHK